MRPCSTSPMYVTDKPAETRRFWVESLGFRIAFDHAAFLGLRSGPSGCPEVGFITNCSTKKIRDGTDGAGSCPARVATTRDAHSAGAGAIPPRTRP